MTDERWISFILCCWGVLVYVIYFVMAAAVHWNVEEITTKVMLSSWILNEVATDWL